MIHWVKRTCFSNLELETQKNRLLLLLMVPLLLLAELNITMNIPFLAPENLEFVIVYLFFYGICMFLVINSLLEKAFKFIFISGMIAYSMFQLWLFNEYQVVYQIMYVNLALAMIYLNGYLIMFTGITTAILTAIGFIFWKDLFFPQVDVSLANIPIILILQSTVVLWGVTKIGTRFRDYIQDNRKMEQTLRENEQQLLLIHERNKALEQYAKQVERLTVLEERNRVSRDIHDTVGHTLTSIIAGLEMVKHQASQKQNLEVGQLNSLLFTARKGLGEIRDYVHVSGKVESDEDFTEALERIIEPFAQNTGVTSNLTIYGNPYDIAYKQRITILRCVQESLTNAVRHGKASRIQLNLYFEAKELILRIEDNGIGSDNLDYGFGLSSMESRIKDVKGSLYTSSKPGGGFVLECKMPTFQMMDGEEIRLMIVDDQELIAESFSVLLELEENMRVVGISQNGQEAIELCERTLPDLILMDIRMPVMNGIESTRMIKERWPHIKIIILTTFQDMESAKEAISSGAEGYLLKSIQPKHLANAIRLVYSGGTLISTNTAKDLIDSYKALGYVEDEDSHGEAEQESLENHVLDSLTNKERIILTYLSEGLKYKDIATKMHYSEGTVKNYVSTIYSKLNVENRMQAVKKSQELNRK